MNITTLIFSGRTHLLQYKVAMEQWIVAQTAPLQLLSLTKLSNSTLHLNKQHFFSKCGKMPLLANWVTYKYKGRKLQ